MSFVRSLRGLTVCSVLLVVAAPACAGIDIPSDGSDGAFNPTSSVEVDLSLAAAAAWDTPSPTPGNGVYDPEKWAVVFKYTEVNIPSGVTVTFKNHPTRAAVVWLVQGDVTIGGGVRLNGDQTEPGPGGFRAGAGSTPSGDISGGFGPGGGRYADGAGSYGTLGGGNSGPTHGWPSIVPLIGGSGSSGETTYGKGGTTGGGAILIASANTISIDSLGLIRACGDAWSASTAQYTGSGGAIRLVAATVAGQGNLYATGGVAYSSSNRGGDGRIRIEADDVSSQIGCLPDASVDAPDYPPVIWPADDWPSVKITHVAGLAAPNDPRAGLTFGSHDVTIPDPGPVTATVTLEATNMPTNWNVVVRIVPTHGQDSTVNAALVSGDETASVWEAQVTIPSGFAVLQARACVP